MQATLDKEDYKTIAQQLLPLLMKEISNKYDLVPKTSTDNWVGLKEFTRALPVIKSKEWVRMFILNRPEFRNWAVNVNPGKGHVTKVNASKGVAWVNEHVNEINWEESLP